MNADWLLQSTQNSMVSMSDLDKVNSNNDQLMMNGVTLEKKDPA